MGVETLAAISIGSSLLGAGVSAFGAEKTGQAQYESGMFKAAVAEQNQKLALEQGQAAASADRMKTTGLIGKQTALQGASGIDVNTGTAKEVRASTAELGELDAKTLLYNSVIKGLGFKQQAWADTQAAKYGKEAGDINAATSLLGGASSVGNKWLAFKNAGVGTNA